MKRLCALFLALMLLASVGLAAADGYSKPTPLYIKDNATALFDNISGNRISIKFQVTNKAEGKTVTSFTIKVWPLDENQDDMSNDNPYQLTSVKTVKPGKTMYSDLFYMNNASAIKYIYIAIVAVTFEDGTSVTYTDHEALNWEGLQKGWKHSQ